VNRTGEKAAEVTDTMGVMGVVVETIVDTAITETRTEMVTGSRAVVTIVIAIIGTEAAEVDPMMVSQTLVFVFIKFLTTRWPRFTFLTQQSARQ